MATPITRWLTQLHKEQVALNTRRQEVLETLKRALAPIGYEVVPLGESTGRPGGKEAAPRTRPLPKVLQCPKCERRFAHPLHLGRHVKAMHADAARRGKARVRASQRTKQKRAA